MIIIDKKGKTTAWMATGKHAASVTENTDKRPLRVETWSSVALQSKAPLTLWARALYQALNRSRAITLVLEVMDTL